MTDPLAKDVDAVGRLSAVPAILRTMRETTGLRFTLVARVTEERWVACAVHDELNFGILPGGELDVTTTLCTEVRHARTAIAIDHASIDEVYCEHRTPKMYGFESYLSVPIFRKNGDYFGNICGLDPLPNVVSDPKTVTTVQLFGELIATQLEVEALHEVDRVALEEQRESARLREQFVAVLGHDVRNPLGSIMTGAELVLRRATDPADVRVLERVRNSAHRITALVDDLLDLARGRLSGGIALEIVASGDLDARFRHVIAEVQSAHPGRTIVLGGTVPDELACDVKRIEQLLSNLLANAMVHGAKDTPVRVTVGGDDRDFELTVTNNGPAIPEERRARLFEPYFRGGHSGRHNGLGLGLYIVSEIAKAHGGTVAVASSESETSFTFRMPRSTPRS